MKRCPECRRDYFDDSLSFCLDDGAALIDGPASLGSGKREHQDGQDVDQTLPYVPRISESGKSTSEKTALLSDSDHNPLPRKARGRTISVVLLAVAVIVGVAAAFGVYRMLRSGSTVGSGFQQVKVSRSTSEGNVESATISPDGKYIAYTTVDGPTFSLWTKHLATNSRIQIVSPVGVVDLFAATFTPDSNYVLYGVQNASSASYDLYQVAVLGGSPRKLIADLTSAPSFSADAKKICFARFNNESGVSSLLVANADGTGEQIVTESRLPEIVGVYGVTWTSDGAGLVTSFFDAAGNSTLRMVKVADGTTAEIMSRKFNMIGKSTFLPDGRALVFVGQEQASENTKLWYLSYPTGEPRVITGDLNSYGESTLATTSDGASLLSLQKQSLPSVYVSKTDGSDVRRISQRGGANDGVWGLSWDGTGRLYSVSQNENKSETWAIDLVAGTQTKIMDESAIDSVTVTKDGRYLVFISRRGGDWQIWRTDTRGADPRPLTPVGLSVSPGLSISPDSRWILYTGLDLGVRKVSIDGGDQLDIVRPASLIYYPQISPNEKYLAMLIYDAQGSPLVYVYALEGNKTTKYRTFELPKTFGPRLAWSPDARSLVYGDTVGRVTNLWQIPLEGGKPKQITNFTSESISNFAYSPDGKQLALARGPVTSDAVLITESR